MRSSHLGFGIALVVALLGGCQPPERAVLIDVHTQGDLDDLTVTVASLDAPRSWQEPTRRINRSADDINGDPLRVAVILGAPDTIIVHLDGRKGDSHFVATRCYSVDGVTQDEVLLFGPLNDIDLDNDGWVPSDSAICREPGADGSSAEACDTDPYVCPDDRVSDCNDADANIHPGAATICLDGTDQDCDGADESCGDQDGDGSDACPAGATEACDCNDGVPSINPRAADICNDGIDQDCSGEDACCDADMDGVTACTDDPDDCDDTNADIPGEEICDDLDNNCNNLVDELPECAGPDLDHDGSDLCGFPGGASPCDCNDCDPAIRPNALELCGPHVAGATGNGADDDCDGSIDEGCSADDADGDGVEAAFDCNDADPLFFPRHDGIAPIENCTDGAAVANDCVSTDAISDCSADTDGDGYLEPAECEGNAAIGPTVPETCNGVDDDCDQLIDEGLTTGASGCSQGGPVDFVTSFTNCGGCRIACDVHTAGSCDAGTCVCASNGGPLCEQGQDCCGDGCKDLQTDADNCGVCGHACGTGESCRAGVCTCGSTVASGSVEACPEPADAQPGDPERNVCCTDTCHDISNDDAACGQCGLACGPHSHCADRFCVCEAPTASEDWDDCNRDLGAIGNDGCEVDVLGTDVNHCGACTTICQGGNASWACSAGSCAPTCNAGWGDCDGSTSDGCEADLSMPSHCGMCQPGGTCGPGEGCNGTRCTCGPDVAGASGPVCRGGLSCCTTGCENLQTDPTNCGACGRSCGAGETCSSGRCVCGPDMSAPAGGEVCTSATGDTCCPSTGGCSNTTTDTANCGGCGIRCAMGERCSGSACGPICGNGVRTTGEGCDDHDTEDGDGCSSTCTVEAGWNCTAGSPSTCTPICGDGLVRGTEVCDDGDTMGGDGCSATCLRETGWTCTGTPSACTPNCGDGMVLGTEACDDGTTAGGDGCASCVVETGWTCSGSPSSCAPICGDGLLRGSEMCDDHDMMSGDGCSSSCTVESGWRCDMGSPTTCSAIFCGDGIRDLLEDCDDGNMSNGDGCSTSCDEEPGWTCMENFVLRSTCTATCGDGIQVTGEACDDGHTTACGECNATCTGMGSGSTCGDGTVCPDTETCDDHNSKNCGRCNRDCNGPGSGGGCSAGDGCNGNADCASGMCMANECS